MKLVDTFTISSAVSTVTIGGGSSGSSSYNFAINTNDVYAVFYHNLYMVNDGAVAALRLTVSGSADTTSNYDNARQNLYANQSFYDGANQNLSYFSSIGMGTTHPESQCGVYFLYNFNNSSEYSYVTWAQNFTTETPEYIGPQGGGVLTVDQACDGVQFFANSGNIASGTFSMYKMVGNGE